MHRFRGMSRGRRLLFGLVVVAALGLAVGGVSLASQGPANNSSPLVLNLISRATAINNFVDTGPSGLSPGDLYVWSDRLFLASAPNAQVGGNDGRCVLIDPATFKFDCSVTNTIAEGGRWTRGRSWPPGNSLSYPERRVSSRSLAELGCTETREVTQASTLARLKDRTS